MSTVSFIITTDGKADDRIRKIIQSIEVLNIPLYEVIVVGGLKTSLKEKNTYHIPFYEENERGKAHYTKKKNLAAFASHYENLVIMHDYFAFDENWYEEFVNFGSLWDIQVQQHFVSPELGSYRYNGWRVDHVPGYPEIPRNMAVPWDIDQLLPYCAIHGSFWVVKRNKMLENPLDENLYACEAEDIEWSSRVIPGWMGQKIDQIGLKIVANPKCVSRLIKKDKGVYPCGPDQYEISNSLNWVWDEIRQGKIRPGVFYYDRFIHRVIRS